jgi:hypothetical protein
MRLRAHPASAACISIWKPEHLSTDSTQIPDSVNDERHRDYRTVTLDQLRLQAPRYHRNYNVLGVALLRPWDFSARLYQSIIWLSRSSSLQVKAIQHVSYQLHTSGNTFRTVISDHGFAQVSDVEPIWRMVSISVYVTGNKRLLRLVATGGIEPPTLGL